MKYARISSPSLVIVPALLGATRLGANQVTYSYEVGRGEPEKFSLNFTTTEAGYVQITQPPDEGEPGTVTWTPPTIPDDGTGPALVIDFGPGFIFEMHGAELRGTLDEVEGAVFTDLQKFWTEKGGTITVVPEGGPSLVLTALVLGGLCLIAGVRGYRFATRPVPGI